MSNHWIKKAQKEEGLIFIQEDFVLDLTNIREARFDLMARICQQYRSAGKTYMPYGQSLVNKEK